MLLIQFSSGQGSTIGVATTLVCALIKSSLLLLLLLLLLLCAPSCQRAAKADYKIHFPS